MVVTALLDAISGCLGLSKNAQVPVFQGVYSKCFAMLAGRVALVRGVV